MKILHYIPRVSAGDMLADYVDAIVRSTADKATVSVASSQKAVLEQLRAEKPDILHLHLCWRWLTKGIQKEAHRLGCAVVLSPHNQLGDYATRHEQRLTKKLRKLAYEQRVASNCDALLATSDRERQQLLNNHWHDRIDVVLPSILNSHVAEGDMGEQLLRFYGKVSDTRYQLLMTDDEHQALQTLLYVGTLHDPMKRQVSHERILQLRQLKPIQWRRMMLMADDEDIRGAVDIAINAMQIDAPDISTDGIARFSLRHPKKKGSLPRNLLVDNPIRKNKIKEELEELPEDLQLVLTDLINAHHLLAEGHLSMRHLSELFETLRYTDFDEDQYNITLRHLGMHRFAERMTAVLATLMQLDEGFQPTPPRMDKTTQRYIQHITNHPLTKP